MTRSDTTATDAGMLALRLFTGLALALAHGMNKLPPNARFTTGVAEMGFPAPEVFAWLSGITEFGGGILVAVGLFTRAAALFIVLNMAVATFLRQAGDPFTEREPSMLFGMIALFFVFAGAGRLSVDSVVGRWRSGA